MGLYNSIKDASLSLKNYFTSLGTVDIVPLGFSGNKTKVIVKNRDNQVIDISQSPKSFDLKNQNEVNALLRQLKFEVTKKKELYFTLEKMRGYDVVETILDSFIDDGLVNGNNNGIIDSISYIPDTEKELINNSFNDFVKRIKPDKLIYSFISDALLHGEYIQPTEYRDGIGLYKAPDNADADKIVCVYEGNEKKYFLKKTKDGSEKLDKDSHVHFIVNPKKIKISITDFKSKEDDYTLPKHILVGRSVIYPVINKIKELQTLEMASLANDLRDILKPTIVQVGMPDKTTPDNLGNIIEKYENLFSNIYADMGETGNLDFKDLLSIVTKIKVLPAPSDGRGGIIKPELVSNSTTSDKQNEHRKIIAQTVGMPTFYLAFDTQTESRIETIKRFTRYGRKLNALQGCIIEGLKEMLVLHVKYRDGIIINPDDIQIIMREIVNMEVLDRMEYLVALMTGLQEIVKLCDSIESSNNIDIGINPDVLHEILNKNLQGFQGTEKLFIRKDKTSQRSKSLEQTQNVFKEVGNQHESRFKDVYNSFKKDRSNN